MLNPFNCPFPFAASFCIYIRFFFGFFTVGYSKLISELFTKSHFSPSAHFTSIHNLSPLASSFKFASSSSRLSACSCPPFLESSSTQILCILDEFSSQFCFHQNFRCWKRARRGKKFVVFRCYFYATWWKISTSTLSLAKCQWVAGKQEAAFCGQAQSRAASQSFKSRLRLCKRICLNKLRLSQEKLIYIILFKSSLLYLKKTTYKREQ